MILDEKNTTKDEHNYSTKLEITASFYVNSETSFFCGFTAFL